MNKHTTKALITSLLSMLLCVSMLIGSTFAWFTDTASTGVNTIMSGNLDVALEMKDATGNWVSAEGKTLDFVKAAGHENETILWEPGCTYQLPTLRVVNNGNLVLKYQIQITGIQGDAKLNEAIEWKIGTETLDLTKLNEWVTLDPKKDSGELVISGHMKEEAGNEYKNLTIEGIAITVLATQKDAEYDSFGNDYDATAPQLISMNGKTYKTLNEAVEAAAAGATITVQGAVEYTMPSTNSTTVDLKGVVIEGVEDAVYPATITFKNAEGSNVGGCKNILTNVTLKNVTIVDETFYTAENGENAWEFTYLEMANVTAEKTVFTDGIILDGTNNFTNCKFIGHNNDSSAYGNGTMYAAWVNAGTSTFTGCIFTGTRGLKAAEMYGSDVATVTVNGCEFVNLTEKPGIALDVEEGTINILNSTFTNTQPGDQGNYMYETDHAADGVNLIINVTGSTVAAKIAEGLFFDGNKTYSITSAEGMVSFAEQVNVNGKTFSGETVKLTLDVDLAGYNWTPIANLASFPGKTFKGTFDGQGHTISNLNTTDVLANHATAGLFGSLLGTVKNVVLDNATVKSSHYAGGIVGYCYGTVEGCTVKNSTITSTPEWLGDKYDNGDKVGGIVGYLANESTTGTVTGNTVENVTITAYRDLGGAVGYANKDTTITNNTVKNVTLVIDKDPTHNYKGYKQDAEHDLGQVVGENAGATLSGNTIENVTESEKYVIKTAAELKNILTMAGDAGAGDAIIELTADVELSETWTPVNVDGYNGADVITLNGNGHTITGLTAPLFAGGFAGGSGIVINDLTIADSTIGSTNTLGSGAFIETVDSMDKITLNNCHLLNSTVSGSRTGGLIGWTSGYNNENDGAVKTYVTIENCSVVGCTINGGFESVGAINGHAGANPWTYTTIKNCVVKDNTLIGGSGKTGVILGTANLGVVTITGCTMTNNTVNGAASDAVYGRTSFGDTGKLIIDDAEVK